MWLIEFDRRAQMRLPSPDESRPVFYLREFQGLAPFEVEAMRLGYFDGA